LVEIISRYTQTFLWLQRYDEGLLDDPKGQDGGELPRPEDAMAWQVYLVIWVSRCFVNLHTLPLRVKRCISVCRLFASKWAFIR